MKKQTKTKIKNFVEISVMICVVIYVISAFLFISISFADQIYRGVTEWEHVAISILIVIIIFALLRISKLKADLKDISKQEGVKK